jgi:hypothetical protein
MEAKPVRVRTLVSWIGCLLALAGCPASQAEVANSLTAQCVPDGAWVCPAPKTIECDAALEGESHTLYVQAGERLSCGDQELSLTTSSGSLAVGTHTITVENADGEAICSAELTVEDTEAPMLEEHSIALWPPNHKFRSIAVEDCVDVTDACDANVTAEFVWASSDEPVDSIGDGHHAPDIMFDDCQHVSVRSERQGPENGRVYKLGVRVVDGSGNATEGVCTVVVAHDQSGKIKGDEALAGDEAYRIVFDGSAGSASCDGRPDGAPAPEVDADQDEDEEDSVPTPE